MRHKSTRKLRQDLLKVNHGRNRSGGSSSTKHPLIDLQKSIGSHAMQRLIRSQLIQPKLQDHSADSAMPRPGVAVGYGKVGNLHGKTEGRFDGGTKSLERRKISTSTGCDCLEKQKCMIATATLAVKYNVTVTITMPSMPKGLTPCEQGVVRDFMNNVLLPHEKKHKRLLETYNTTTRRPIEARGCSGNEANNNLDAEARLLHADEAAAREKDARDKSNAIDPFFDMFDTSKCDK